MTKQTITFSSAKLRSMSTNGIDQYMANMTKELVARGVDAAYKGNQWRLNGPGTIDLAVSPDCSAMFTVETPDGLPVDEANTDTKRLDWIIPVVSGEDTPLADNRTALLLNAVIKKLSGRDAIDAAMLSE
jgi:hypothetical protein